MKRGFTLIELLAVIVILAIIALIATPVILNIIDDARTSSYKRSIDLFGNAVEQAVARYQLNNSGIISGQFLLSDDGKTLTKKDDSSIQIIIDYTGNKIESDNILIMNGKVYIYNIKVDGKEVRYSYGFSENIIKVSEASGDIPPKYAIKVNDEEVFNFYVLSTEGNNVNLIMDKNICEDGTTNYNSSNNYCMVEWHASVNSNSYGPDTAMKTLYNATKNWTNIDAIVIDHPDKNYDGNNIGYKNIKTNNGETIITGNPESKKTTIGTSTKPLKARFAKENETALYCDTTPGSCPFWIVENLTFNNDSAYKYFENNNNKSFQKQIYGYWLLDSSPQNTQNASNVHYDGHLHYTNSTAQGYGIRPVITVPNNILN